MSVELTAEVLRELLDYDPETGFFTWMYRDAKWFKSSSNRSKESAASSWNTRWAGVQAATSDDNYGYKQCTLLNYRYKAHRLAWLHFYGYWPDDDIDHINGVTQENRILNLRAATRSENHCNKRKYSNNKSGYKGVCWDKSKGKWMAQIQVGGKGKFLGYFSCPKDGHSAYQNAADIIHKEYKNYG